MKQAYNSAIAALGMSLVWKNLMMNRSVAVEGPNPVKPVGMRSAQGVSYLGIQ